MGTPVWSGRFSLANQEEDDDDDAGPFDAKMWTVVWVSRELFLRRHASCRGLRMPRRMLAWLRPATISTVGQRCMLSSVQPSMLISTSTDRQGNWQPVWVLCKIVYFFDMRQKCRYAWDSSMLEQAVQPPSSVPSPDDVMYRSFIASQTNKRSE